MELLKEFIFEISVICRCKKKKKKKHIWSYWKYLFFYFSVFQRRMSLNKSKRGADDKLDSQGIWLVSLNPTNSDTALDKGRPRWLSWMRRPTGDQEVAGSTPAEVGNILSWRLIIKYFLRSSFRWFKKGSCQFLAKECAQYWLTA